MTIHFLLAIKDSTLSVDKNFFLLFLCFFVVVFLCNECYAYVVIFLLHTFHTLKNIVHNF